MLRIHPPASPPHCLLEQELDLEIHWTRLTMHPWSFRPLAQRLTALRLVRTYRDAEDLVGAGPAIAELTNLRTLRIGASGQVG